MIVFPTGSEMIFERASMIPSNLGTRGHGSLYLSEGNCEPTAELGRRDLAFPWQGSELISP